MLSAALDAAGLTRAVIGLGDADLYRQLLAELGVERETRDRVLDRSATHDLVGLELAEVDEVRASMRMPAPPARPAGDAGRPRGSGPRAPSSAAQPSSARRGGCARPTMRSPPGAWPSGSRLDLGLLRDLGYYTGAILEVYDPALGHILGGGGRYDTLLGRFGRELPAAGFALYLERLHVAQAEEERQGGRRGADAPGGGGDTCTPGGPSNSQCRAVRSAGRRSTPLDRIGVGTRRAALRLALAGLRGGRADAGHDAALRRSHLRRGRGRRPRHHRQGRPARAAGQDRLRGARPWLRRLPDGPRRQGGGHGLDEDERRLGAMRIATKYPRIAERHFEETGRQAEVIEVKGSVELAPLSGLAEGIVDLVATGRTLAENGLEVREEIADCTARLIANRVAHKLRAGGGRRPGRATATGGGADADRVASSGRDATPDALAAEIRALQPQLGEVSEAVSEISPRSAGGATSRRSSSRHASARVRRRSRDAPRAEAEAALARSARSRGPRRARDRRPQTSARSPRRELGRRAGVELAAGPARSSCARSRSAAAGVYAPGRRAPPTPRPC